jgi:hypothetical protein
MTKPILQAIDPAANAQAPDPFAPENLRLSQSFTELVAVKRILTTVPVRKPSPQDFVRVHPDPKYRENFPVVELKDDREEYIVGREVLNELSGEFVGKTLYTAINRQGTVFLWPVRLPSPEGKDMDWWRSGHEAAERATKVWLRIRANQNLGAYEMFEAQSDFGEPEWPNFSFAELLKIAFRGRLIRSVDHPVIKRLRGLA